VSSEFGAPREKRSPLADCCRCSMNRLPSIGYAYDVRTRGRCPLGAWFAFARRRIGSGARRRKAISRWAREINRCWTRPCSESTLKEPSGIRVADRLEAGSRRAERRHLHRAPQCLGRRRRPLSSRRATPGCVAHAVQTAGPFSFVGASYGGRTGRASRRPTRWGGRQARENHPLGCR
jgi:hypothetical protein